MQSIVADLIVAAIDEIVKCPLLQVPRYCEYSNSHQANCWNWNIIKSRVISRDKAFKPTNLKQYDLVEGVYNKNPVLNTIRISKSFITTYQIRFKKRFELFYQVKQPPPLSYDDYEKGSDFSCVSQNDLLASSADSFRAGKAAVDKVLSQLDDDNSNFNNATPIITPELWNYWK